MGNLRYCVKPAVNGAGQQGPAPKDQNGTLLRKYTVRHFLYFGNNFSLLISHLKNGLYFITQKFACAN